MTDKPYMIRFLLILTFLITRPSYGDIQSCINIFTHQTRQTKTNVSVLNQTNFKAFKNYEHENAKFIEFVKNSTRGNYTFLRIENALMKLLNDKILKNKKLSYSLSISFQTIFYKNLKELAPDIHSSLNFKYHDFKSLNLVFNGSPSVSKLDDIFETSLLQFEKTMATELKRSGISVPKEFQNLESLHTASIADSLDEAALASKFSRKKNLRRVRRFSEFNEQLNFIKSTLKRDADIIENHSDLIKKSGLLDGPSVERFSLFNLDLINLARKSTSHSDFFYDLKNIYPSLNSKKLSDAYYNYIQATDQITASVLTPKSTSLGLGTEAGVVFSIDIGQMGAEGILETIRKTHRITHSKDLMRQSRKAFWVADTRLKRFYSKIDEALDGLIDPSSIKVALKTSGDDAIFDFGLAIKALKDELKALISKGRNPSRILEIKQRLKNLTKRWSFYNPKGFENYMKRLSNSAQSYRFRIVSINPRMQNLELIPRSSITPLIEMSESLEKIIRKGFLKSPIVGTIENKNIIMGIEAQIITSNQIQNRFVIINKSKIPDETLKAEMKKLYNHFIRSQKRSFKYEEVKIDFLNN